MSPRGTFPAGCPQQYLLRRIAPRAIDAALGYLPDMPDQLSFLLGAQIVGSEMGAVSFDIELHGRRGFPTRADHIRREGLFGFSGMLPIAVRHRPLGGIDAKKPRRLRAGLIVDGAIKNSILSNHENRNKVKILFCFP